MCSKIVEYTIVTKPNGRTRLREDVSYLFCDDLWREIKSFLFLPHTLASNLAKHCPLPLLKNEGYWVCAEAEANPQIRGAKTLAKLLRSNNHWVFDREGNCRIKGLNLDLYYRFLRDAKKKQTTRAREERERIIREYKPYRSATGGYFLYSGIYLSPDYFNQQGRSRQEIIDSLNKEDFSSAIKSGIRCYWNNTRGKRLDKLFNQLKDAVGDLFDAVGEELRRELRRL